MFKSLILIIIWQENAFKDIWIDVKFIKLSSIQILRMCVNSRLNQIKASTTNNFIFWCLYEFHTHKEGCLCESPFSICTILNLSMTKILVRCVSIKYQCRGGSTSWPCVVIATHEFSLTTEFSVAKAWKSVSNYFSGINSNWKFSR